MQIDVRLRDFHGTDTTFPMQLSVKGKQIDVGDALRQHVETSLSAIVDKYFGGAIEAHAVFSREAHLIRSDISVHIGRDMLVQGQAEAGDAYAAFDNAAGHIAKRIRRYKRRLRDHHVRPRDSEALTGSNDGVSARSYVLAEPTEDNGPDNADETHAGSGLANGLPDQPVIVAEMTYEIPRLSVSEAVMRMDLADLPILIFRNSAHDGLNVVYRRRDGHIGWIDADLGSTISGQRKS